MELRATVCGDERMKKDDSEARKLRKGKFVGDKEEFKKKCDRWTKKEGKGKTVGRS